MFVRILTVGLCLLLFVGCTKKKTDSQPPPNESAGIKPQSKPALKPQAGPNAAPAQPNEPINEPNWIGDPRAGRSGVSKWPTGQPLPKDQLPVEDPQNGGKQPWVQQPPQMGVGDWPPEFQPVPPGMLPLPGNPVAVDPGVKPGAGKPMPGPPGRLDPHPVPPPLVQGGGTPRGAANRVVALADMRDLQVFIDTASLVTGKMPSSADIYKALIEARSPCAALVQDGLIILTGTTQRDSVWAYEARARISGGMVVSQNGVETLTAAELNRRLGK